MSYPKDLDEYTEQEMREELARRMTNRDLGLCDYCGRPGKTPPCRMRDRHMKSIDWVTWRNESVENLQANMIKAAREEMKRDTNIVPSGHCSHETI